MIADLERAIHTAAEAVGASVVGVAGHRAAGSGVVIGPRRVLTNAHNVGAGLVRVSLGDGRVAEGRPLAADPDGDLAVIDVDTGGAPALEWGVPEALGVGAAVIALADPAGRGLRATLGFISATGRPFRGPRGRRIQGAIEHTAPLPPGSSGGPLVDLTGRMVGLNTHRLGEGFYLAVPATEALRRRVEAMAAGQVTSALCLGVGLAPGSVARRLRRAVGLPEADGLLVRQIEEGSPAQAAGIAEGDLLTAAAGDALLEADDLHAVLDGLEGNTLELEVLRGTERRFVTVAFPRL